MKWNAWGDPAAAKPLSDGIRSLLKQALGVEDSDSRPNSRPTRCGCARPRCRDADRDALAAIVGTDYCRVDDRDRLLRAGGKSTLDLLRRKDSGVQDAPDAVLLPGDRRRGRRDPAATAREHGIAVVPFGGGTSVVGGLDPDPRRLRRRRLAGPAALRPAATPSTRSPARPSSAPASPGPKPNGCSASTASRSGISRRASSSPPSAASPRPARPARTRRATAGSTT